ncbi:histidinol-phosphate transaminase [Ornithinibacillus sp. L9]|uniref:Histidinol-phosphate aminotransferase n=1 Tax=Ornithinibacillus caprae TaxID=2678566 RepID=A0A6N8FCU3_9BACI|nr:histidinol-phosphate transaminase [Ornithinibacillus caprae]MUK87482.1 histidinol-phosphate transaminase [Ornithinibacillus caprae]
MKWKEQIHNLRPYQPGKATEEVKKQYQLESIIKLASNENPYGFSPNVVHALHHMDSSYMLYPDGNATKIRAATASHLDVNDDQLMFTNGTDELIQIISRALLTPDKNTVMATPTFPQYKHSAIIEGAEVREVKLKNGNHALENMLTKMDENTAVVWICNPNNPTGSYIPETEIRHFLASVPNDVLVVLDEAYYEYVTEPYDSLSFMEEFPNIMIMRTFSKIYGLASFRIGYGISSQTTIKKLEPIRLPFNTNVLGQLAATAAISDQEFVEDCRMRNRVELEKYYAFCEENNFHYFPSQGNFILINVEWDGDEVAEFLLSKGIIVRSGKALGFPTSVRITVGQKHENKLVRNALAEWITTKR